MSSRSRAALAVATIALLAVLFVVLRPTENRSDDNRVAETTATTATEATESPARTTTQALKPAPAPKPAAPKVTRVVVEGLEPTGGITKLSAEKGDTVRFTVSSDQPEKVHLHGYDVEKAVSPRQSARFEVKADIEGIFEVELENSAVEIAKLTVQPQSR